MTKLLNTLLRMKLLVVFTFQISNSLKWLGRVVPHFEKNCLNTTKGFQFIQLKFIHFYVNIFLFVSSEFKQKSNFQPINCQFFVFLSTVRLLHPVGLYYKGSEKPNMMLDYPLSHVKCNINTPQLTMVVLISLSIHHTGLLEASLNISSLLICKHTSVRYNEVMKQHQFKDVCLLDSKTTLAICS